MEEHAQSEEAEHELVIGCLQLEREQELRNISSTLLELNKGQSIIKGIPLSSTGATGTGGGGGCTTGWCAWPSS